MRFVGVASTGSGGVSHTRSGKVTGKGSLEVQGAVSGQFHFRSEGVETGCSLSTSLSTLWTVFDTTVFSGLRMV